MSKDEKSEMKSLLKERDKIERDALVERMQNRDKELAVLKKGGAVVENPSTSDVMTQEDKLKYIPELRAVAREKYLEQREEQQLDLFKRRLDDEARIFGDQALTENERRLNELNNCLYELAQKRRQKVNDAAAYRMPDAYEDDDGMLRKDKKMALLTKRYEEEKVDLTEQELWENFQQKKAIATFGTKSGKSKETKNYELLIEN